MKRIDNPKYLNGSALARNNHIFVYKKGENEIVIEVDRTKKLKGKCKYTLPDDIKGVGCCLYEPKVGECMLCYVQFPALYPFVIKSGRKKTLKGSDFIRTSKIKKVDYLGRKLYMVTTNHTYLVFWKNLF